MLKANTHLVKIIIKSCSHSDRIRKMCATNSPREPKIQSIVTCVTSPNREMAFIYLFMSGLAASFYLWDYGYGIRTREIEHF
jgi:hypothetical protein